MKELKITTDPRVPQKFSNYPPEVKVKMGVLRNLIIETASLIDSISEIEETLKWGEPSYLTKNGSTIRMDWKERAPDQYAMYFSCSTVLVATFKELFGNAFKYEKNRAIILNLNDPLPTTELKKCVSLALQYKILKSKPLLGE